MQRRRWPRSRRWGGCRYSAPTVCGRGAEERRTASAPRRRPAAPRTSCRARAAASTSACGGSCGEGEVWERRRRGGSAPRVVREQFNRQQRPASDTPPDMIGHAHTRQPLSKRTQPSATSHTVPGRLAVVAQEASSRRCTRRSCEGGRTCLTSARCTRAAARAPSARLWWADISACLCRPPRR